jgi:hypothetical protein
LTCEWNTNPRERAYRYEKITSMSNTNLLSAVGMKGEMKAGMKNTTERTA